MTSTPGDSFGDNLKKDGGGQGEGKNGDGNVTGDGAQKKDGAGKKDTGGTGDSGAARGDGTYWWYDGSNPGNTPSCWGNIYQCADGKDNDGDGLIDAADPECTGPCDDSEASFILNIPGVNVDICKHDCYWDNNSGQGNDDCNWTYKCDPKNPGSKLKPYTCAYDPSYTKCPTKQSTTCLNLCLPITPNGCDCFGCCEVYVNGKKYKDTIYLGSGLTCTSKKPENCVPCTQVTHCMNKCGPCELCLGKTIKDLPSWCFGKKDGGINDSGTKDGGGTTKDGGGTTKDGGGATLDSGGPIPGWCPPGIIPCLTNAHCPTNYYCITGCCQQHIVK